MSFIKGKPFDDGSSESDKEKKSLVAHSITGSSSYSPPANGKVDAFLGQGCKVVGTLIFSGPVEIDCQVEGEIQAQGQLMIGENALINAKIIGVDVVVRGVVNGDILAQNRLSLVRSAKVTGNISSPNLSIEEGVVFEGKCSMGKDSAYSKREDKGKGGNVLTSTSEKLDASA